MGLIRTFGNFAKGIVKITADGASVPIQRTSTFKYRGIPEPVADDNASLVSTTMALKEVVETLIGQRRDDEQRSLGKAVILNDLYLDGSQKPTADISDYLRRWPHTNPLLEKSPHPQYLNEEQILQLIADSEQVLGFYNQVADDVDDTGTPLASAAGLTNGKFYYLTAAGAFATTQPNLGGLTGNPNDRIVAFNNVWIHLAVPTDYLSSVAADTAAGKITFAVGADSTVPAAAPLDLIRKQESDTNDAQTLTDANAYADSGDAATLVAANSYADSQDAINSLSKVNDDTAAGEITFQAKTWMQAALDMNQTQVLDLPAPSGNNSAARKRYVDDGDAAVRAYADDGDAAVRVYADTQDDSHSTDDRAYTDQEVAANSVTDQAYADAQDAIHSTDDRAYADDQDAAHVAAADPHTQYAQESDVLEHFVAVGYGGFTGGASIAGLGALWETINNYSATEPAVPRNMVVNAAAGSIIIQYPGIYTLMVNVGITFAGSNQGRTTYMRLYNLTDGAQVTTPIPVAVGRNQEGLLVGFSAIFEVEAASTDKQIVVQMGDGDSFDPIILNNASFQLVSCGEFRGVL